VSGQTDLWMAACLAKRDQRSEYFGDVFLEINRTVVFQAVEDNACALHGVAESLLVEVGLCC